MLGPEHARTAAVAFALGAFALVPDLTGASLAAGIIMTAGAGLVPDLDEPHSTFSREAGFLTIALSHVVRRASGGHRKLTHSLLGIGIFGGFAEFLVLSQASIYARAGLVLYAGLLGGAALHALEFGGHRARTGGHWGDLAALTAAVLAVFVWHVNLSVLPWCIALGAAAHIAGDMITHDGCPLFYPLSKRDYALLPHALRITTGKFTEHRLIGPALTAALVVLAVRDAAALDAAHRLLLV